MTADPARITADRGGASNDPAPRLLIADDDRFVQSSLCAQLDRRFDIVASAINAEEAIELAELHQPDVAIIDVEMPAGGGLRAVREIRVCSPNTAIVALSGDESRAVVLALLEAGAIAYLRKGMATHELTSILLSAITAHAQTSPTAGW